MSHSAPPRGAQGLLGGWQRFWFEEVPPHSLALVRILLGALGALAVVNLTPVETFWSVHGLSPVPGGGAGIRGLIAGSGVADAVAWLLFASCLSAYVCVAIGFRTRIAVAAAFVAAVGQIHWNALPLNSGHYVAAGLWFCLVWSDCGAVLSVDARRAARSPGRGVPAPGQPIWPLRLMRFQIAIVYLNTGLGKLYNPLWREGSAMHYVLNQNVFARFPDGIPAGWEWMATLGTYVTLTWEIAFAFLLLHRVTRRAALLLGVALHLGMAVTLEVGLFSWVMLTGYVAFLDPHAVPIISTRSVRTAPNGQPRRVSPPERL